MQIPGRMRAFSARVLARHHRPRRGQKQRSIFLCTRDIPPSEGGMSQKLSLQEKRWRTIIVTLPIIGATSCKWCLRFSPLLLIILIQCRRSLSKARSWRATENITWPRPGLPRAASCRREQNEREHERHIRQASVVTRASGQRFLPDIAFNARSRELLCIVSTMLRE